VFDVFAALPWFAGRPALGPRSTFRPQLTIFVSEISHLQLAPALTTTYNTFRLSETKVKLRN
jgi:hypothetical protein